MFYNDKLTEMKGEIKNSMIVVGNSNAPLSVVVKIGRRVASKQNT